MDLKPRDRPVVRDQAGEFPEVLSGDGEGEVVMASVEPAAGVEPGRVVGEDEPTLPTAHEKIRVWQLPQVSRNDVQAMLQQLRSVIDAPREEVISALHRFVPEFMPDDAVAPVLQIADVPLIAETGIAA